MKTIEEAVDSDPQLSELFERDSLIAATHIAKGLFQALESTDALEEETNDVLMLAALILATSFDMSASGVAKLGPARFGVAAAAVSKIGQDANRWAEG